MANGPRFANCSVRLRSGEGHRSVPAQSRSDIHGACCDGGEFRDPQVTGSVSLGLLCVC